jgi:hypothetical protein
MNATEQVWNIVKENKDLNLPATKVMVATVRCEEIAALAHKEFLNEEAWHFIVSETGADAQVHSINIQ